MDIKNKKLMIYLCVIILNLLIFMSFLNVQFKDIMVTNPGNNMEILKEGDELIQTFFSSSDVIKDVKLQIELEHETALIEISIYDNTSGELFFNNLVSLKPDENKHDLVIYLEKVITNARNKEYYVKILVKELESPVNNAIKVMRADKDYQDAHLFINGAEVQNDLYISYVNRSIRDFHMFLLMLVVIELLIFVCIIVKKTLTEQYSYNKNTVYLDLMRLIAALGVLLIHTSAAIPFVGRISMVAEEGTHGVEIFMLISGYLIIASLQKKERLLTFYIKRFFRIIPVYYFIIIFSIIYLRSIHISFEPDSLGWLRYFLFLSTSVPATDSNWNNWGATWTISCFVLFYLFAPIINKIFNTYKKSLLYLASLFLVTFCIMPYLYVVAETRFKLDFNSIFNFSPFVNLIYFGFGVVAYYAVKERKSDNYIILLTITLILREVTKAFWINSSRIPYAISGTILLILLCNMSLKNSFVKKIINRLSAFSYTLYLIHPIVFFIMGTRLRGRFSNSYMYGLISILIIFVVTYIIHHLIEEPFAHLSRRICKKLE